MRTFTLNPSGLPEWLKRGFLVLLKNQKLRNLIIFLISGFLLSTFSQAQTTEFTKGYSKADVVFDAGYLDAKQKFNQKKDLMDANNFAAPVNDLCENAIPISCDETVNGSTSEATFDNVGTCGTSNTAPGVWYSFVATSGVVNLSTCNQADYDTKISVFTGTCNELVCIGGQDDAAGCAGFTTSLTVLVTVGETYYVLVHGFEGATGNFTLSMTCFESPANDLCENALPISCGDVVVGNTELASNDDAPVEDCVPGGVLGGQLPGYGVWYTIEGTGADITLSTCNNANYDTRIDVYSGSCGDLTCITGNDDNFPDCTDFTSELTFASDADETYYVYVVV